MEYRNRGMRIKTINAIIANKFKHLVDSITDENVKKLVQNNSIVTGGCIASMMLGEKVNDFDIYFQNKETVLAVANYYLGIFNKANTLQGYVLDGATLTEDEIKNPRTGTHQNMTPDRVKIVFASSGVAGTPEAEDDTDEPAFEVGSMETLGEALDTPVPEVKDKPKYFPVFISPNAISLSSHVQLILRFYGNAETIHKNYDFVHCTNYWTSDTGKVNIRQQALEALLAKELVYIGSKYPVASLIRTRKFVQRGWVVNAGQFLKMAFQVSQLDLNKIAVLEDQLIGVDFAYFNGLLDALRAQIKRDEEKEDSHVSADRIEYSYITTIIDKMF